MKRKREREKRENWGDEGKKADIEPQKPGRERKRKVKGEGNKEKRKQKTRKGWWWCCGKRGQKTKRLLSGKEGKAKERENKNKKEGKRG